MSIGSFLQSAGGAGLIAALSDRGMMYGELEDEMLVSTSTLSKRKNEALDIGLIEMKPAKRLSNNRTVTEYHLTDMGERLAEELAREGVTASYREMRAHQRALDKRVDTVAKAIRENASQFYEYRESFDETMLTRNDTEESDDEIAVPGEQIDLSDEDLQERMHSPDSPAEDEGEGRTEVWGLVDDEDAEE